MPEPTTETSPESNLYFRNIEARRESEFFIAIGKQGVHSFLMLGVMVDGSPTLLARVAKQAFTDTMQLVTEAMGEGAPSCIINELFPQGPKHVRDINYQAYAINFEQVNGFLALIHDIEHRQLADPDISRRIKENADARIRDAIARFGEARVSNDSALITMYSNDKVGCYIPPRPGPDGKITFIYQILQDALPAVAEGPHTREETAAMDSTKKIQTSNTCRTTALNIVECILGFPTGISKYFFIAPKYKTKLVGGQPDKDTFYILPPPPKVYSNLSGHQMSVLNKLYKRLEGIPKLNPGDPGTRSKFEELKKLYVGIAGQNDLTATQLYTRIAEHNNPALFARRTRNFFNNLFPIPSTTERMIRGIKTELEIEKRKESPPDTPGSKRIP